MSAKNLIIRGGADFSGVKRELDKTQKNLTSFQKGISKTMKGIGAILGGLAIGSLVKDFVQTAARTEVLGVAMQSVARASGYATDVLNEHKKAVMDMGIAEQEAMQILTRFMQAQLDTADASRLARVAQDAAVIANMNSSEAAEQMTEAIAKQRPILLSAFGMTKNMNEIYKDYAKTIGKTTKQLSSAEKKQAMLNYILEEGEKIAGTYEASMGVVGKQISSLPRYWDTLKNAVATPLALPGLSVVVEEITNSLKGAINWAEANKTSLQSWGQSIASAARTATKGLKMVGGALAENWEIIKFVGTTLLSYVAITKTATAVTAAFRLVQLALKGELMMQIPLLSRVSLAIGTYRLQMALAPVATNIFTGALLRLRVALYAVYTALGPVGWGILAISAAISGGMALWSKYSNSLNSVAQASTKQVKSGKAAAGVMEDQAEAMEKAGKAAKGNLQGFDEIHQLQKDMAGSGEDALDDLDLGGMGAGGAPTLDLDGVLKEIEQIKPTLKGFWKWIKESAGNLWDGVKVKWNGFKSWTASWTGPLWDNVKVKWGGFTDWVVDKWGKFKVKSGEIWGNVKTNVQTSWEALKTNAPIAWDIIKTNIETRWSTLNTGAKKAWGNIQSTVQSSWDALKKDAPTTWENIKSTISIKSNDTQNALKKAWDEISKFTAGTWNNIKSNSNTTWESIKSYLTQNWNSIQSTSSNAFNNIKNSITNTWNSLRSSAPSIWESIKNSMINPIESAKRTLLNIIDSIKNAFNNMRITIPKPKLPEIKVTTKTTTIAGKSVSYPSLKWLAQGGIINGPSIVGVGEAGAEAVLPLERNTGWMDTLAAKIATSLPGGQAGGDIYVYVGNEQVDAYIQRSNDRRNVKSNGR